MAWRGVLLERLDEGKLRSELSRILRLSDEEETAAIEAAGATPGADGGDAGRSETGAADPGRARA